MVSHKQQPMGNQWHQGVAFLQLHNKPKQSTINKDIEWEEILLNWRMCLEPNLQTTSRTFLPKSEKDSRGSLDSRPPTKCLSSVLC